LNLPQDLKLIDMSNKNKFINKSDSPLKIAIHGLNEIKITDYNKIVYCKAEGNYTRIYLVTSSFLMTKVLKHIESILPKNTFLRIHKSYLININYVIGFKHKNTIILDPDIKLPIARRRKAKILNKVSKYLLII
jgi:two-component system LytT family response regulator